MCNEEIMHKIRATKLIIPKGGSLIITHDLVIGVNNVLAKLIANYFFWIDVVAEQTNIHKGHCYDELYVMCIKMIMAASPTIINGDIVEFGCYTGISTSKLSIAASLLQKKLFVFDSFKGLPDPNEYGTGYQKNYYHEGSYSSTLNRVVSTVTKFGMINNVSFSEGWFKDTLNTAGMQIEKIAYCFIDVDLTKSFIECIEYVLPRLQTNGIIFSHEADDEEYKKIFEQYGLFNKEEWYFERIKKITKLSDGESPYTNTCFFVKKK